MLGAGVVLGAQALLVALAVQSRPLPRGSADPSRGDSLGPDLDAVPPRSGPARETPSTTAGGSSSSRRPPPPFPRRNPSAASAPSPPSPTASFASRATERASTSPPSTSRGARCACAASRAPPPTNPSTPGPRTFDGVQRKTARVRRSDGGSAFQSSSPTQNARCTRDHHRVLWCYALSDAAKEAWTVALHRDVHRSRAMVDRAMFSAAAAAAPERRGVPAAAAAGRDDETAALLDHLASIATGARKPRRVEGAR